MTPAGLETLLRVALPPLKLALRARYLEERRQDPAAATVPAGGGPRRSGRRTESSGRSSVRRPERRLAPRATRAGAAQPARCAARPDTPAAHCVSFGAQP